MKKVGRLIGMALVLSFLLVQLSFAGGEKEAAESKVQEEITAVCGTWVIDRDQALVKEKFGYDFLEKFREETGITVKLEGYPFRQLFQVIEVKLTAKDPKVDILWVDSPLTASYAVRGYTKPIGEDLLSKEELKDFFPATVEIATWDGNRKTGRGIDSPPRT